MLCVYAGNANQRRRRSDQTSSEQSERERKKRKKKLWIWIAVVHEASHGIDRTRSFTLHVTNMPVAHHCAANWLYGTRRCHIKIYRNNSLSPVVCAALCSLKLMPVNPIIQFGGERTTAKLGPELIFLIEHGEQCARARVGEQ